MTAYDTSDNAGRAVTNFWLHVHTQCTAALPRHHCSSAALYMLCCFQAAAKHQACCRSNWQLTFSLRDFHQPTHILLLSWRQVAECMYYRALRGCFNFKLNNATSNSCYLHKKPGLFMLYEPFDSGEPIKATTTAITTTIQVQQLQFCSELPRLQSAIIMESAVNLAAIASTGRDLG